MNDPRWERVKTIVDEALQRDQSEREAFIDAACAADPSLRREVESLLEHDDEDFLATPAGSSFAPVSNLSGQPLAHYQIKEEISRGGMGIVYRAHDTRLNRDVALKCLPPELMAIPGHKRAFLEEARAAASLNHPNIAVVHEVNEADGVDFIAMELVEGKKLRDVLDDGPVALEQALTIAIDVATGLVQAHARGIVHRDLKPSNILLAEDGHAKIIDFGIAKLVEGQGVGESPGDDAHESETRTAMVSAFRGTPAYMSPEQVRGRKVDVQSDQFAFGVVLYEMLEGGRPFKGAKPEEAMRSIVHDPVPGLSVRGRAGRMVQKIVSRCLAKTPEDRYPSMSTLLDDLRRAHLMSGPRAGASLVGRLAVGAIAALAIAGVAWNGLVERQHHRILVLPIDNLTGSIEYDYLADGLTEELIGGLGRLDRERLSVIARTSSMAYRGTQKPIAVLASELGVDYVVEGSLREEAGTLRVSAALIRAEDESQLWAGDHDRPLESLLDLQRGLARAVGQEIGSRAPTPTAGSDPDYDPEAYRAYVIGRYHLNQRGAHLFESRKYFERAVEIDPNFALGYAGLADTYQLLSNYGLLPGDEAAGKARAAAIRSIELEPDSAQAQRVYAGFLWEVENDWLGANAAYERAITLDPNYAATYPAYSAFLQAMGQLEEGLALARKARDLDPVSLPINVNLARALYFARRYDEAIAQCEATLELDRDFRPAWSQLALIRIELEQFDEAFESFEKAGIPVERSTYWSYAIARSGDVERAREILDVKLTRESEEGFQAKGIAVTYVGLSDLDQAFLWLRRSYEYSSASLVMLPAYPFWDDLRDDPRYLELLRLTNYPM